MGADEIWTAVHHLLNGALLAGEMGVLRSFMDLKLVELILTNETIFHAFWKQWGAWETDGHVHSTRASWLLILRSVATMLEEEAERSRTALHEWLPPAEELIRIAEFEDAFRTHSYGAVRIVPRCRSHMSGSLLVRTPR